MKKTKILPHKNVCQQENTVQQALKMAFKTSGGAQLLLLYDWLKLLSEQWNLELLPFNSHGKLAQKSKPNQFWRAFLFL